MAAERRRRMRLRLLEAAMAVLAQHGAHGAVIDLVIDSAGVARGTFYNYFRNGDELMAAVAREVSDQMLAIVDPVVLRETDPVARIATGVRLVLMIARGHPALAAFMVRGGVSAIGTQGLAVRYLARDLDRGMKSGAFPVIPRRAALDVVAGSVLGAFHTLLAGRPPRDFTEHVAAMVLQALGVPREKALAAARRRVPPPEVPRDSLLARVQARAGRG